jgi:hypothetical protein
MILSLKHKFDLYFYRDTAVLQIGDKFSQLAIDRAR